MGGTKRDERFWGKVLGKGQNLSKPYKIEPWANFNVEFSRARSHSVPSFFFFFEREMKR